MHDARSQLSRLPVQVRRRLAKRAAVWRTPLQSFKEHDRRRTIWHAVRPLLVFAVAYVAAWSYLFIAAFLGAKPPPAPLFPPGAVLFCALLLAPPRHWWRFLLMAFLIQVPILAYLHLPLWWNLVGFIPDAVEPIVAASLIRWFIPLPLRFASLREVSVFTACATAGVLCGATLGSAVNAAGGEPYWTSWETWFLGDLLSCLLLTPTLLLWIAAGFRGLRADSGWQYAEGALLYGGLTLLGVVVFDVRLLGPDTARALIYLPVPLLLWAAVRFGPRGIASALTLIVVLAVPAVANALGPFASQSEPEAAILGNVFTLQLFLLVIGVPLFFLASLVQERQAARAEAEQQAEQLNRIFEQSAEGLTVYDAAGRQVRANAAQRRLLGLDTAPPDYDQLSLAEWAIGYQARDRDGHPLPTARSPLVRALQGEVIGGGDAVDIQLRTWDGRALDISASASPLRGHDGRIIGAVGVFRDQTQRMQLERQLAEQAEQLDRIVEAIGEGLFVYDTQGRVVRTNAAARHLLGLDTAPPEFSQLSAEERLALYTPRDQQGRLLAPQAWLSLRAERDVDVLREPEARDIHMRALDGRELEVSSTIAPLRTTDGQVMGGVLLLSDRTERNQLAREREEARAHELAAQRLAQQLDQFFAMAAHDIRSPLTALSGSAQYARLRLQRYVAAVQQQAHDAMQSQDADLTTLTTPLTTALDLVQDSVQSLSHLVGRLFDVARARSGTLTLDLAVMDLAALVREQLAAQQLAVPDRRIELDLPHGPVAVVGDAVRLGQVLTNYLTNALKYSADDQPVVVRLAVEDQTARLAVEDRGSGLSPEQQTHVWDLYHQVPNMPVHTGTSVTLESQDVGLGLGLYIVKRLVELHPGGQVGVDSIIGQGSTFWYTLPLAPVETGETRLGWRAEHGVASVR